MFPRCLLIVIAMSAPTWLCCCRSQPTAPVAKRNLLADVPIGTSSSEAIQIMTRHGFRCTVCNNAEFTANNWDGEHQPSQKFSDLNYVRCQKIERSGIVTFSKDIALVLDDSDRVSNVLQNNYGTGP